MDDKREIVCAAFEALCRTITVANGYSRTVSFVDRQHIFRRDEAVPCLLLNEGPEEIQYQTTGWVERSLPMIVTGGIVAANPENPTTLSTELNTFLLDFWKCIHATPNIRLGGLLSRTMRITRISTDEGFFTPRAIFIATVMLVYRHQAI